MKAVRLLLPFLLVAYQTAADQSTSGRVELVGKINFGIPADQPGAGGTYTAASCDRADVQTAITAELATPLDGDIIAIPAGSCTWTATITASFTTSVTIQGAGAVRATDGGSSTTGTDLTNILDHHATSGHSLLVLTAATGKTVRVTGLKIYMDGGSTTTQTGVIVLAGGANSHRVDHNHFAINADSSFAISAGSGVAGVIDHNYFDGAVGNGPFGVYLNNGAGTNGDSNWTAADGFGGSNFLFIEDNRFRNGQPGDANTGGQRFVFRYNTGIMEFNDSGSGGYVANHGITSGRGRSTRALEFYHNTFSAQASGLNKSPIPINGGAALVWGNTLAQYRYVTSLGYTRKDNTAYNYGSTPSGWGNCTGTTGTVWDGTGSPGAYPCLDQPGRGAGDLLSGTFSSIINTRTGNAAQVIQALSPIYVWSNSLDPAGFDPIHIVDVSASSNMVAANRDYYQQFGTYGEAGTFNGTAGVGEGLLSARPSTCTAGPGGNTPGVGYWATDTQTLYVCTATNTWSTYYQPYTYPHPLQSA